MSPCSGGSCSRRRASQYTPSQLVRMRANQGGPTPPGNISQAPLTTPAQTGLLQMLSQLGAKTAAEFAPRMGGDPYAKFDPYAQKARQGFQGAVPTIAERFVNMSNPESQGFSNQVADRKSVV